MSEHDEYESFIASKLTLHVGIGIDGGYTLSDLLFPFQRERAAKSRAAALLLRCDRTRGDCLTRDRAMGGATLVRWRRRMRACGVCASTIGAIEIGRAA